MKSISRELTLKTATDKKPPTQRRKPAAGDNNARLPLHKTIAGEFYRIAFRKKLYENLEELQADADEWIRHYNEERPHSGKYCNGAGTDGNFCRVKTPGNGKGAGPSNWRAFDTNNRISSTGGNNLTVRASLNYYTLIIKQLNHQMKSCLSPPKQSFLDS